MSYSSSVRSSSVRLNAPRPVGPSTDPRVARGGPMSPCDQLWYDTLLGYGLRNGGAGIRPGGGAFVISQAQNEAIAAAGRVAADRARADCMAGLPTTAGGGGSYGPPPSRQSMGQSDMFTESYGGSSTSTSTSPSSASTGGKSSSGSPPPAKADLSHFVTPTSLDPNAMFAASQVPIAPASNMPLYIGIGGALVLVAIVMVGMRSAPRAAAAPAAPKANTRRRRRRK